MLSISRIFPAYTATQATLVPSSDQFPQLLEWYRRQFRHTLFPCMDYCCFVSNPFFNSLNIICEAKLRAFLK